MSWSYLAGLFDGEGSVTLTQHGKGWGVIRSTMCIAGNSTSRDRDRSLRKAPESGRDRREKPKPI